MWEDDDFDAEGNEKEMTSEETEEYIAYLLSDDFEGDGVTFTIREDGILVTHIVDWDEETLCVEEGPTFFVGLN